MVLEDMVVYRNIIGCLMKDPTLLLTYQDIMPTDFLNTATRVIYISINTMFVSGKTVLTPIEIDQDMENYEDSRVHYLKAGGIEFLQECLDYSILDNFDYNYKKLKKLSLISTLKKNHYDVSYYFQESFDSFKLERTVIERFETATLEDILDNVEGKLVKIRENFLTEGCKKGDASVGVMELIEDLKASPGIGYELNGELFNAAAKGARKGCYYLKSASTSAGKTRTSVFDACKLAFPVHYDLMLDTFVEELDKNGKRILPVKTLFIVTEMEKSEIQSIMLAYISKVNEDHIISGNYELGEYERVVYAGKIMQQYKETFFIEEVSSPNLANISAIVKRYATIEEVEAVFFDYIHTTGAMMSQFAENGLREDSILMLMSNQLKQLAKDCNVFMFSATQVNANAMTDDGEFKNETCIRGSKATADKCDVGYVMTSVNEKMWNRVATKVSAIPELAANLKRYHPTHIIDIYKMRRGRYKNVRIWLYLDLGNGERKDLFMTTADNEPIREVIGVYNQSIQQIIKDWKQA